MPIEFKLVLFRNYMNCLNFHQAILKTVDILKNMPKIFPSMHICMY